jgi:hypothetical protein
LLIFLVVMEFLTFHCDVLTKILISVHTYSEKFLLISLVIVEFLSLHCDVLSKVFISIHTNSE